MSFSQANAAWNGSIKAGQGMMHPAHGPEVPFSLATRFEGKPGSNPEEMLGSALAGCFSMALSLGLEKGGLTPESIKTSAKTYLEKDGEGFSIPKIQLTTEIKASGGDAEKIKAIALETKKQCPVSKALASITIELEVKVAT